MKRPYYLALPLLAVSIYAFSSFTLICWAPEQGSAALAWNLGIILAPVLAFFVQLKLAGERGLPTAITLPVIAVMNTAMILGSRMGAWTISDWSQLLNQGVLPETQGKTIIGGLLLSIALFWVLKPWWKLPMGMADILIIGLPLAAAPARIGCFLAGCCYGAPTESGWGVCYGPHTSAFEHYAALPSVDSAAILTQPLYPVQLFMLAGNLLIFFGLWWLRHRFSREGAISALGLALLSFQRFGLEFIRDASTDRGTLGHMVAGLKLVQWQSLALVIVALVTFVYLQFLRSPKNSSPVKAAENLLWPQILLLSAIIAGAYALGPLMTLDEGVVVVFSCLPALYVLSRKAWEQGPFLSHRLAPLSFLSISLALLVGNPVDSLIQQPGPGQWKHWFDLSGGYSAGRIERKVLVNDCNGTHVKYEDVFTHTYGGTFGVHWAKNDLQLSGHLKGAGGRYDSPESSDKNDNNNFLSLGLSGKIDHKLFGLSLGIMHRNRIFDPEATGIAAGNQFMPVGSVRLGALDDLSLELIVHDDPIMGFLMEPQAKLGLRWGFNNPYGDTYLAGGIAYTSTDNRMVYIGGVFPILKNRLFCNMTAYAGTSSLINFGLKYRFDPAGKH